MDAQLPLIDSDSGSPWQLDEQVRELGRRGVHDARAALTAARRRRLDPSDADADSRSIANGPDGGHHRRPQAA